MSGRSSTKMFTFEGTRKSPSCRVDLVGTSLFTTTRGRTKRWATGLRQRSTGRLDHAGWMRGSRRAAGSWSEMGANGAPRGLRWIGAYPDRGVGVKLVRSYALTDQPGWDTPE